jgi:ankyrin repeat protein
MLTTPKRIWPLLFCLSLSFGCIRSLFRDPLGSGPDLKLWPLAEAASSHNPGRVQELLNSGNEVDQRGPKGFTALHWAVMRVPKTPSPLQQETVRILLSAGADPNTKGYSPTATPLELAVVNRDPLIVELMLKCKGDALTVGFGYRSLLHKLAGLPNFYDAVTGCLSNDDYSVPIAELLISHGCRVDMRDDSERTPLMLAAHNGEIELLACLLTAGADSRALDKSGRSAIDYAKEASKYFERFPHPNPEYQACHLQRLASTVRLLERSLSSNQSSKTVY